MDIRTASREETEQHFGRIAEQAAAIRKCQLAAKDLIAAFGRLGEYIRSSRIEWEAATKAMQIKRP